MRAFVAHQRRRLAWLVRPRRTVAIAGFDVHIQRWGDVENADVVERDELTLATFNVWFRDYFAADRYQSENAVLSGDFNLRDAKSIRLPPAYVDARPTLHPLVDGFTEDTSVNLMLADRKRKHRQERFDRVLVKGEH